jgi:hypothetical protein
MTADAPLGVDNAPYLTALGEILPIVGGYG